MESVTCLDTDDHGSRRLDEKASGYGLAERLVEDRCVMVLELLDVLARYLGIEIG